MMKPSLLQVIPILLAGILSANASAEPTQLAPSELPDLVEGIQTKGDFVVDPGSGAEPCLVNLSGVSDRAGDGAFASAPLLKEIPGKGYLTVEFDFLPTPTGVVMAGFSKGGRTPGPMVGWVCSRGLVVREAGGGAFAKAVDPLGEKLKALNPGQWYRLRSVWDLNQSGRVATLEMREVTQPAAEFKKLAFDAAQSKKTAPLGPASDPSSWTHLLLRVQNNFEPESAGYPDECSAAIRNIKVTWSE